MQQNILIIEDDQDIRESLYFLLEKEGMSVILAENGEEGLLLLSPNIHLVILDIMMPGISGIETCRAIRERSNVPVLFLTAKDQEADKLIGFSAGGDDYLVKPFSFAELLARVNALLRRRNVYDRGKYTAAEEESDLLCIGDICIDQQINHVTKNGMDIEMTELEYQLLLLLMKYPQKIFTVTNIYESVWNEPYTYMTSNTVMVYIRRVRKKIEDDPHHPTKILTVWGKGYRFGK